MNLRRLLLVIPLILAAPLLAPSLAHANENAQGWCEDGAQVVVTSGLNSTTQVQASYPQCTITVFVHGGGLATIYSDNGGPPTPLANPFVANTNGQWLFYAANGRYDVTMSGAGFPQTVTYSDILLCDPAGGGACGGGGGGGTVTGTGTLNYVTEWYSTTSIGNASGYDDRVHPVQWPNGVSIMSNGLYLLLPNANPGTVVNNTVCRNPSNQAVTCASGGVNGLVGSAQQGAGNAGNVQVCYTGSCLFVFDNQTTPGDWAILSATTAGSLHDVGSSIETPGYQNVLVTTANAGATTTASVAILTPDEIGLAPKTGPLTNPYGVTTITNSYTVQTSDASHTIDFSTSGAASQTITLPQPGSNGTGTFVQSTSNTTCSGTTCLAPTLTINAGDSVIVTVIAETTTGSISPPTDSVGDVFVALGPASIPQSDFLMQSFWARTTVGGSVAVTATVTASASNLQVFVADFVNLTAFDQFGAATGGIHQGITSAQITTTQPVEVLIASVEQQCGAPNNPGAGYQTMQTGTDSAFMWQGVAVVGNYVGGLAATCGSAAHWAASVASFIVNGSAPSFLNGFWVWVSNHSAYSVTVAAAGGSDIINCDGTTGTSVTLASLVSVWYESNGVNWTTAGCAASGSGTGTVTEVDTSSPLGGGPITTTGTLTCTTCVTSAASLTSHAIVLGAGSQASAVLGSLGTTTTVLHGNAAGAPSFAAVTLTTDVTGVLPIANGGTGSATVAKNLWFGNNTSGTTAPGFESIGVADLPFTYTTSNGATLLLTASGSFVNGDCIAMGANGNAVDNGSACGSGGGGGTVTSVALALPASVFTVSGSPVTTTGTLTGAFASQSANIVFAGPVSGSGTPTFRALVGADLPDPTVSTLGGVQAKSAVTHQWINSISASGVPLSSQPAFTDISGVLQPSQGPLTTEGDLWYFHSSNNARLAVGTNGQCLISNGTDPLWSACTPGTGITLSTNGTNNSTQTVLNLVNSAATNGITLTETNTSGGTVQLGITGTLAISGGGTGQTTANAAFNALSPLTTEGDVIYYHSGVATRLALGANGSCLQSNGTDPVYGSCATGTITGGGTTNAFALFSSATSIASAPLTLSGSTISTTDTMAVGALTVGSGAGTLQVANTITGKVNAIAFSTTPAINLSLGNVQQFACTTGGSSIVPSAPSAIVAGMQLTFVIVQNGSSACTWAWPSNVHGGGTISATLSTVNTQSFVVSNNGTDLYAASAMVSSTGGTP